MDPSDDWAFVRWCCRTQDYLRALDVCDRRNALVQTLEAEEQQARMRGGR